MLFGIQGPDHMERLPGDFQNVLAQVDLLVRQTPLLAERMPSFLGAIQMVMERLERDPVAVEAVDPATGDRRTVKVGRFDLQCFTRNLLASGVREGSGFISDSDGIELHDFDAAESGNA